MAGIRITSTIDYSGPFFENDPGKTFRQNGRRMIEAVVKEGAIDVIHTLMSGESSRAPIRALGGRVHEHVFDRVESLAGKPWQVTGVISINNSGFSAAEGISLMAAAAVLERKTKAFARARRALLRARAVNVAELLRGIA